MTPSRPPRFATEDHPEVARLRTRLDDFYRTTQDYTAFQQPRASADEWPHVVAAIQARIAQAGRARVLEFGVGLSAFGDFLGKDRPLVHLTMQDVTPGNREFLRTQADELLFCPLAEIGSSFDVIFSTFVLEHVSNPKATLEHLCSLLSPGGVLLLFCPRYDVPFYLSHSADHYSSWTRARLSLWLLWRRFRTFLTRQPAFLIHCDPAVFQLPFILDRDAVHWVSLFDLECFFAGRGQLQRLELPSRGSWKQWIVKRFLTVNLAFTKSLAA